MFIIREINQSTIGQNVDKKHESYFSINFRINFRMKNKKCLQFAYTISFCINRIPLSYNIHNLMDSSDQLVFILCYAIPALFLLAILIADTGLSLGFRVYS